MDLDPEKMRLKRMEEQLQADRRKLEEERRQFDLARRDSQPLGSGQAPAAAPQHPPNPSQPQYSHKPAQPQYSHNPAQPQYPQNPAQPQFSHMPAHQQYSPNPAQPLFPPPLQPPLQPASALVPPARSGGLGTTVALFLGVAGGVLLLGIGLLVGRAYLAADSDEAQRPPLLAPLAAAPATAPVTVAGLAEVPTPGPVQAPVAVPVAANATPEVVVTVATPLVATPSEAVAVLTPSTAVAPVLDEAAQKAADKAEAAAKRAEAREKKRQQEKAAAKKQAAADRAEANRLAIQAQGTSSKTLKVGYLRQAVAKDPGNALYPPLLRQAEGELLAEQQAQKKREADLAAKKAGDVQEASRLANLGMRSANKSIKIMYLRQAIAKDPLNVLYRTWLQQAERELAAESSLKRPPPSAPPPPGPAQISEFDKQSALRLAAQGNNATSKSLKVAYLHQAAAKDPTNYQIKTWLRVAEQELAAEEARKRATPAP